MATKLADGKRVTREVERDRLVVTLAPEGIYTREVGRRTTYGPLALGKLHLMLARMHADARLAEKRAARRRPRVRRGAL